MKGYLIFRIEKSLFKDPKSKSTFAMNIKHRVEYIDQTLDQLYPSPPVPLDHRDPYTLLIAVLLSAQCTDERVNLITPALFDLADCPRKCQQSVLKESIKLYALVDWLQESQSHS